MHYEMEMMLSRSYSSEEEFAKDYKKFCCENSKAKEFYLRVLIELGKAISEDDIESFKKLSTLVDYTSDLESKVTLEESYDDADNPIRSTNLVILASKHNGIKILQYLLDSDSNLLNNLSVGIGKDSISPKDEDDVHHNAFYYAIRSEDIQLLDTLITNKYFAVHLEELEEILSKTYEELQLKNVPLSDEMQYFVEHKLIDQRFFSTGQHPGPNTYDATKTNQRIELLLHSVRLLKRDYLKTSRVDGKFLYVTKFIARNIHILKGRLRSTYDRIPWEEMEFCLIIFISSQTSIGELNLFYRSILNKDKILNYLENFANKLRDEEDLTRGGERKTREDNVKSIIATHPPFKELYDDYHQIRDVYSLKRISDHIKLLLSTDAEEEHGKLIIIRVLQVIGEHVKNTPQSPKLSHNNSELLVLLLSKKSIKVITELRDAISHAELSKIIEIEEKADSSFLINIQDDVRKLGDMITEILYKNKIKTIRLLLNRVAVSKTSEEIKEVLEELNSVAFRITNMENFETVEHEKLKELVKELSDNLADKTNYENKLFNKLNSIISSSENKTKNTKFDYLRAYSYLQAFNFHLNYNNYTDEYLIEKVKNEADKMLNSITAKVKSKELKEIVSLSGEIFRSVKSSRIRIRNNNVVKILKLIIQINFIVEFETREIKWINNLKEQLKKTKTRKRRKLPVNQCNNQLDLKVLRELSSMLDKNSQSDIKSNDKLQCVVKMFVLGIMSILDTREDYLQNNILFLDDNTPLLHGKCLRNYLAHDNALVDVLLPEPLIAVILNAKKLTEENITESTKKIGKLVSDDPVKLRQNLDRDLNIIANQERMFVALKDGDLDGLRDSIEEGADIKARSTINSWTTLHFAASGPSLAVVRFILDQNLSVDVKDNSGGTPLHIAAAHGRPDIVNFFCKETDIRVDVLNNKLETPLNVAVQNGHRDVVENLLQHKADIFIRDSRCFSPLFYAITNNCIEVVKILLRKDLNIDIDEAMRGFNALHVAALHGHLELVNLLLDSGANINATTDKNEEPLHLATLSGKLEVVNALILRGADVNARNIIDWTPLHYAANSDNFEIVISLLTNRAHVNIASAAATPLHIAAESGNLEIVEALLEHGANINRKLNHNGATPLNYAAQSGHKEVVEFLIQKGAHIHSTKNDDCTALHAAVAFGHQHVAHLLIQNKAEVNAKSIKGITAMHTAALNDNKEIIDLLIRNEGDVRAISSDGSTPLHFAAKKGQKTASDFLIKNEADINARNDYGLTPLHMAALHDHKEIVNLLIENNARVNVEDIGDMQPLHVAALAGHKEIVEILIAKGANINYKHDDQTALHYAINNNHKDVVEFLIENGAKVHVEDVETWSLPLIAGFVDIVEILMKNSVYDVSYKDSNHYTPLHIAAFNGHKKIVKALIANGADVHAISVNNETPLLCAAREGFEEVVEILILARRPETDLENNRDNTPLRAAAKRGHCKVVTVLLDHKIDVDDTTNNASVRLAVAGGHLQVVKILLEYMKVNIDTKGEDGFTLLHIASEGTNLELVKYLVGEDADINATTSDGYKAIHLAASKGYEDTVEYFVEEGSSFNELGAQNKTPLHCAAMGGHLEVANYLLKHHADVNATETENGFTPMHFAATGGYKEVIRLLLENDAIYNADDQLYRKPLDLATNKDAIKLLESTDQLFKSVETNNYFAVQNYITEGAFVNALNTKGVRPLHCAARKGYDELVRVLLQNKANPNVVDFEGLTPLHYAAQFSHLKVVQLLLSYYAVYNTVSDGGKTPLDFTVDTSILSLFKLVTKSFKSIEDDNPQVINDLNKIRDIDTVKAIMCARNRENRTLIVAAMHSNFSEVEELKEIGQGDVSGQITKAIELSELEQFQKALFILDNALKKRKEILGSDNPGTLDIQKYIATVLRDQGDYEEALSAFENILQKQIEMLDFESKDILNTRSLIATVMCRQRKIEKALGILQEVYQKQIDLLGSHDEDTIVTQWEMALILYKQGKLEEALNFIKTIFNNTNPDNHLRVLALQSNMAMILADQDNHEQALHIYEEIYEKMQVALGLNHSVTLGILGKIGAIFVNQKKYNKALAVFTEVLSMQEKDLKPNHPDIMKTQFNIGNILFAQEKWISALKVYRGLLQRKEVFGSNHPNVVHIIKQIETINFRLKLDGDEPSEILRDKQSLRSLLENKLDNALNAIKRDSGSTLLHLAAMNGSFDFAMSLLKQGEIYNITNNEGKTPLDLCKDINLKNMLELVEELFRDAEKGNRIIIEKLKALKPAEYVAVKNVRNNQNYTLSQVFDRANRRNVPKLMYYLFGACIIFCAIYVMLVLRYVDTH